ncbi:hypothetical protein [Cetobacterium sp.]|uniref:hypothetical protein n=1 Tax=Cetobacterium sp. TaxID=2071632 RepID=UPI003EE4D566
MSNPSVFELAKIKIDDSIICIEDNIGEAIHVHIGPFRIDLTINEFLEITEKIENVFKFLLKEKEIDILEYNKYFLMNFRDYWLEILKVENKEVRISELKIKLEDKKRILNSKKIIESPFYRYYQKEEIDLEIYENTLDIFQTNKEKADEIYNSIKKNQFASNNECIVIDNEGYILDGEEKVCSLLSIYGENYLCSVKVFTMKDSLKFGRKLKEKKW